MRRRVLVTGTDYNFSPDTSLEISCPDFLRGFLSPEFELVAKLPAEFLISFNHHPRNYSQFLKAGGDPSKTLLIRLEPECVYPSQYKKRVTSKYGHVLSPGRPTPHGSENFIRWPYAYHNNPTRPSPFKTNLKEIANQNRELFTWQSWKDRDTALSLIAANKVSAVSNSNYLLRKKLAHELRNDGFAVYGPLWGYTPLKRIRQSLIVGLISLKQRTFPNLYSLFRYSFAKYKASKGEIENKHEILKASKYTLVIENSNTIVTEKLFDALLNGSVPLYVGPDLASVGLPPDIAIEINGMAEEVYAALVDQSEIKIQGQLDAMLNFLASKDFLDSWSSEIVFKELAQKSIRYFEASNK
jgi:hypothetical protein